MIVSGEQPRDSATHIHVSTLPQTPLPSRLPHHIEQSSLRYTVGPCWLSILNIAVPYVTKRGVWRVQLLATQKSINRPGWWKGNFALFQMLATWVEGSRGRVVDICSKADFPQWQEGQELLQTEVERWWGTTCKNSTVISDSHLQTGHRWSNQHHLQIGHR